MKNELKNELITEGSANELIAQFMGGKIYKQEYGGSGVMNRTWELQTLVGLQVLWGYEMKYDTSWDWLMPAVKKWNDLVIEKRKQKHGWMKWQYMTVMLSTDIKKLHTDLVEAIKWYNSLRDGGN